MIAAFVVQAIVSALVMTVVAVNMLENMEAIEGGIMNLQEGGGSNLFVDMLLLQTAFFIANLPMLLLVTSLSFAMIRRLHDVGLSGWWILVPFYNLLLVVQKSDGDNQWGPAPQNQSALTSTQPSKLPIKQSTNFRALRKTNPTRLKNA